VARHESDREDLLREATALVERCELHLPTSPATEVVAGFRRNGALSVFFGADPVVQFDPQGRLRRAYWRGSLLKAEGGQLIRLEKRRTETESLLIRSELEKAEEQGVLREIERLLGTLLGDLEANFHRLIGQVPPDNDVVARLRTALAALPRPIQIADQPHAGR
jgi:hypothetical protein